MKTTKTLLTAALLTAGLSACNWFDDDDPPPPAPGTTTNAAAARADSTSETDLPDDVETAAVSDSDSSETATPIDVM